MARISKTQIYAVRWLHSQKRTAEEIAEELTISLKQVKKLIEESFEHVQSPNIQNGSSLTNSMIINKTNGKQNTNVTILTKEASTFIDAQKSNPKNNKKNANNIFKIHDK
jgi:orotate phosphoribosyltransferase-like protein